MLQLLRITLTLYPSLILASTLPDKTVLVPLVRIRNSSAHGAVVGVGTPPQRNIILLDTGSFSFTFENPKSDLCKQADEPCAAYGSYDNATSSTAIYAGFPAYDGVQDFGSGSSINDTITLGEDDQTLTIANATVGHLDSFESTHPLTAPQTGFLGMRAQCVERICHGPDIDFLEQLYSKGLIAKRAFSIYLGPDDPNATGAMIVSGLDRAKQAAAFVTVPMADVGNMTVTQNSTNYIYQSSYSVTLLDGNSTRAGSSPSTTRKFTINDDEKLMLVDTGVSRWDMPHDVFVNGVAPFFGIEIDPNEYQFAPFAIECSYRNASLLNTVNVYFNDDADVIKIPLAGLVTEFAPGQCILNVDGTGGIFGAPFLRNVLSVFDNEAVTVGFSQVKYTDEEDIVAL